MKKSIYLLLILALPGFAVAQTTQKKTTTTKTTTTVKKAPAKKPAVTAAKPAAAAAQPSHIEFQTFVTDEVMMVNSNFQIGKDYVVIIKNDKKETMYTATFNAQSAAQNVSLGRPLGKGTFYVTVHEKNNPLATGTITLVMN
ncbi:MAG: hypothetical protein K0R82_1170 [Flavipsychrobacter sp.]|jgi:hypothetical protein|nr:hypothetical protein [Flavipsychrobacter sp.]